MFWRATICITALLWAASAVHADQQAAQDSVDYLAGETKLRPVYRFEHSRVTQPNSVTTGRDLLLDGAAFDTEQSLDYQPVLNTYDAAIAYPVLTRGVNLDLGVNIKFFDGRVQSDDVALSGQNLQTAVPMLYANALVDLPLGLEAGFEGSYSDIDQNLLSDYRAKIRYSLDSGFGFQGGWQHHRIQLGEQSGQLNFTHEGPFFDLFYNF